MNPTSAQKINAEIEPVDRVDVVARVRASIAPVLSSQGVSLVDLVWATDRAGWVLRLTIEREGTTDQGGGVTMEDCVDVSRAVSAVLDAEDFIAPQYNLEVSSPGLDRPLRTPAELARFMGKLARVKLSHPAPDGQLLLRGALLEAPEGRIAVLVDGKRIEAALADVAEANLVFELESQPKKAQPKKGLPSKSKAQPRARAATDGKTGRPAGKSS